MNYSKLDSGHDQKLKILDDALKKNAILLNSSENARKTLESKLKQAEDQTRQFEAKLVSRPYIRVHDSCTSHDLACYHHRYVYNKIYLCNMLYQYLWLSCCALRRECFMIYLLYGRCRVNLEWMPLPPISSWTHCGCSIRQNSCRIDVLVCLLETWIVPCYLHAMFESEMSTCKTHCTSSVSRVQ